MFCGKSETFKSYLTVIVLALLCVSATASLDYLIIPGGSTGSFQTSNFPVMNMECSFPFESVNSESEFLSNLRKETRSSEDIRCITEQVIPANSFFLVRLSKIFGISPKYKCHFKEEEVWTCESEEYSAFDIIFCQYNSLVNSRIVLQQINGDHHIMANCISNHQFKLNFADDPPSQIYYQEIFPLEQKNSVFQDQRLLLLPSFSLQNSSFSCYIFNHQVPAYKVQYQSMSYIGCPIPSDKPLIIPQEDTSIDILATGELEPIISFGIDVNIVTQEISGFRINGDQNGLFLIGRKLPKDYIYTIWNQDKSIRAICENSGLYNTTNNKQVPDILYCKCVLQDCLIEQYEFPQLWTLAITSKNNDSRNYQISFKLQQLINDDQNTNIMAKSVYYESGATSFLGFPLDSSILSQWLLRDQSHNNNTHIIDCDFFADYSSKGLMVDSRNILCPIPKLYQKTFKELSHGCQAVITVDTLLQVKIAEPCLSDKTASFPLFYRMLDFSIPYSFSPLDQLIIDAPEDSYQNYTVIRDTMVLDAIFELKSYSVALITIDLRFLSSYNDTFTYEDDWEIFITVGQDLTYDDLIRTMPDTFTSDTYEKSAVHEFLLIARVDLQFKVNIIIKNADLLNLRYAFINSTSVEIVSPYRANFNQPIGFYAMLSTDTEITLPINIPDLDANGNPPSYWLELGSIRGDKSLTIHDSDIAYEMDPSVYWGTQTDYVAMPYFPFFSNCKAFDRYIPIFSTFEQSPNCGLVAPEDTVYIKPFGFGSQPVADNCTDITFECIYDEDFDANPTYPRWFEDGASTLFYLTKDPQEQSVMDDYNFNTVASNFIPVVVEGAYEEGKIPSLVKFQVSYYQYSKTQKRLVKAKVTLDNFITPTDLQQNGTDSFGYTLEISYIPLGHTDLIIAFEFEWYTYMLLYVLIGLVMAMYVLVFFLYHFVLSRERKKIKTKIWGYIVLVLPAAFKGIMFAVIPMVPLVIILDAVMTGKIWTYPVHGCANKDTTCNRSIFDTFTQAAKGITDKTSKDFINLRNGRTGFAFIVVGLIIMILSTSKFVKKQTKEEKHREAYDGNIWDSNSWTKSALIMHCIFHIGLVVAIIQFSFTTLYGENVFVFIGLMKILGMSLQFIYDRIYKNRLLFAPMLTVHTVMESIVTFGAIDFLDFLVGNFVDLAIQMVERAYAGPAIEGLAEYLEEKYEEGIKFIKRTLLDQESTDEEEDEEESEKEKEKEEDKEKEKPDHEKKSPAKHETKEKKDSLMDDSSDSNIILTNQDESIDTSMSISILADIELDSDMEDSGDDFEVEMKKRLQKKEKEKKLIGDMMRSTNKHEELEDKNEAIDTSFGFLIDTLALLFTPFFILLMWAFYDENKLGTEYNIAEEDFKFYFLYAVVIIPFQVVIDIWHYNIVEYYTSVSLFEYFEEIKHRFLSRLTFWKIDDDDIEEGLEDRFHHLDQACFSSQFYFIVTVYSSGMLFVVMGMVTMVAATHQVFEDVASYYILVSFIAICLGLYLVTMLVGKKLKIWEIKVEKATEEEVQQHIKSEEVSLEAHNLNFIVRRFGQWTNTEKVQATKDRIQEVLNDLQINKFPNDEFKSKLILDHQYWFTSNIKEVFTPTTLKNKRADIIQSFKLIYGELSPRASRAEQFEDIKASKMDMREKKVIKKSLSSSFINIMKQWKFRAALIRKIRSQVAGIIESSTGQRCEFCGTNHYLRAELVPNIESMFIKFLKDDPSQTVLKWSVDSWQEVFIKNALIRTLCFDCSTKITEHHIVTSVEETRIKRLNEKLRQNRSMSTHSMNSLSVEHKLRSPPPILQNKGLVEMIRVTTEDSRGVNSGKDDERLNSVREAKKRLSNNKNVAKVLSVWLNTAKQRASAKPPQETFRSSRAQGN